jgi:hypothetical protein
MAAKTASAVEAFPFLVRVKTNNRIHVRYQIVGRTLDDGRCGIDDNWVRASADDLADAEPDRLCRFCFPATTGD